MRTGDDMVEVELGMGTSLSAVLASRVIARVNIPTRESHSTYWDSVISLKNQDTRDLERASRGANTVTACLFAQRLPALKIEHLVFVIKRVCKPGVEHAESSFKVDHIDGLKALVQHQYF